MNEVILTQDLSNYTIRDVGYIYVIEDKEKGIVKIGRSANPKERINNIKTISCVDGREYVSHKILGMSTFEKMAHNSLSGFNVSGEWFKVSFEKAIEVVANFLPREITSNQIIALEKKEEESSAKSVEFFKEMVIPKFLKNDDESSVVRVNRVDANKILHPNQLLGVARLSEIFEQEEDPASQEWEDGYSDAVGEWMRLNRNMTALLSALEVLNINDFADVWRAYELNLAKAKLKEHEENQIH